MIGKRAFTLFEVLAVLALIALVASLAAVDFAFLDSMSTRPVDVVLKNAIRQAKASADFDGKERALYFNADSREFVLRDYESAKILARIPLYPKAKKAGKDGAEKNSGVEGALDQSESSDVGPAVRVVFKPVIPESENSFESAFGRLEEIPCLRFYPDGASTECIISLSEGGKAERFFKLNPFAEVPVETSGEE